MIYERQFGDNVVLTAVNRNDNRSYDISGLYTNLPAGSYDDELDGIMNGSNISVSSTGAVTNFTLGSGECAVWQYTATDNSLSIGNINPGIGISGNTISIAGQGFGDSTGTVSFGTKAANVVDWSDSLIDVEVPDVSGGKYAITVTSMDGKSDTYSAFEVLNSSQVATRFYVNNAETSYGQSVYIVGNVEELGSWDTSKAIGPFFNNTSSIATYPTWFYDISVPSGKTIEYKYIKKDSAGNVTWESGDNHTYRTVTSGTGTVVDNW